MIRSLALLTVLAVAACSGAHDLTACKGPYVSIAPPPSPVSLQASSAAGGR